MRHSVIRGTSSQEGNSTVLTDPEPDGSGRDPDAAATPQTVSRRPGMERSVKMAAAPVTDAGGGSSCCCHTVTPPNTHHMNGSETIRFVPSSIVSCPEEAAVVQLFYALVDARHGCVSVSPANVTEQRQAAARGHLILTSCPATTPGNRRT